MSPMEEKKFKQLEKFVNERLPEPERDRVILIINGKPLSWKQVLKELKKEGDLADTIENKFEEMLK